jgi:hypothetical protein
MRPILLLSTLLSLNAYALDRCYVEAISGGKSTCYLPANNATFVCDGQDKTRSDVCFTKDGQRAYCELRTTSSSVSDIWCQVPIPAPVTAVQDVPTVVGTPYRIVRPASIYQSAAEERRKNDPLARKLAAVDAKVAAAHEQCQAYGKSLFYTSCMAGRLAGPPKSRTSCKPTFSGGMDCETR